MTRPLETDVFTETVEPLVRSAKKNGATADKLTQAFLGAVSSYYGAVVAKESAAKAGFQKILDAEGGSVNAAEAAKLYGGPGGCTEEAVRKAARQNQVISVRDGLGNVYFPVWQFGSRGGVLPGVRQVLEILRNHPHYDDLMPFTFLLNPSARLSGLTPLEAIKEEDGTAFDKVKQLAEEVQE